MMNEVTSGEGGEECIMRRVRIVLEGESKARVLLEE
jgi:hypothetical protein